MLKTIYIDWNDENSIRKAEKQKTRLENEGYNLKSQNTGFLTASLTYEKINKTVIK
jgi:hypothetical protein